MRGRNEEIRKGAMGKKERMETGRENKRGIVHVDIRRRIY